MSESIRLLLMIVVGGIGTIHGAIFGAFFIVLLPTALSWVKVIIPGAIATSGGFDSLAFGLILLGFILFEPDGLLAAGSKSITISTSSRCTSGAASNGRRPSSRRSV